MAERILLSPPHMSGNEMPFIEEAFATNWIAPAGPNIDKFEKELADYVGVKDAAVTSSGTAAIHLALAALGVKEGDSVFCASFTFIASANPIRYLGAEVTFIDSEPETWNMSPQALERALEDARKKGKLPKAILVVHLYGQSAKMDELMEVAARYGVPIVEDAAESLGALYKGKMSGTHGSVGIYSFNGNKIITTSGGGALVSDDEDLIKKARFLASQAKDSAMHYQHSQMGYNYRMTNITAGIGRGQLKVLNDRVRRRREIFRAYEEEIGPQLGISFMPELEETMSNRWLTTMTIDPRIYKNDPFHIISAMDEKNIETRALWKPLHLQPLYAGSPFYKHEEQAVAVCETLFATGLCLPSGSSMTEDDQDRVIDELKTILLSSRRKLTLRRVDYPAARQVR